MIATILIIAVLGVLVAFVAGLVKLFQKGNFKTIVVILLAPYLAYEVFQYYWYAAVLPSQFKITYPVSIGDEWGFREGCGVAVFKISDETIEDIQKNGLNFFDGATQARGLTKPKESLSSSVRLSDYSYHTFKTWQETPVPPDWLNEGSWFMCSVIRDDVAREIVKAAKLPGSFYTTMHEGELVVIPSLGYIVLSFYG